MATEDDSICRHAANCYLSSEALEGIVRLMVSLRYEDHPDDTLVIQAKAFCESVMTQYVVK